MAAARSTQPKDRQDNSLILYRLQAVENAVRDLGTQVANMDNIKKVDLKDMQETILGRLVEFRVDLQKQIDDKADKASVDDLRTLIKGVGAVLGSIIVGLVIYYITNVKR